jgi:PadR family transcriptional regulator, regulatory protein PadR
LYRKGISAQSIELKYYTDSIYASYAYFVFLFLIIFCKGEFFMPRGRCKRHGDEQTCTCAMGNLYRFVEPLILYNIKVKGVSYGYDLLESLNKDSLTDSLIEAGALYRNLRRLEQNGCVVSEWDTSGAGPAKRFYRLTPRGDEHLGEWVTVLSQLADSMRKFVDEASKVIK